MVCVIRLLQCPHQQEVSAEFPSLEISCEEALTAQTKSSSAPLPTPHQNLQTRLRQSGQTGVGVNRSEGQGQTAWEEMNGNKEALLLPLAWSLSEHCLLTGACSLSPLGLTTLNLERKDLRRVKGLLVNLHP